jgi:hypothetical protein
MTQTVRRSPGQVDRWRPFRDFDDLYGEVDKLVQSVVGGSAGEATWLPAADITETDDAYIIEIISATAISRPHWPTVCSPCTCRKHKARRAAAFSAR